MMEFNKLKSILKKYFSLEMTMDWWLEGKDYRIKVYYSEDGSKEEDLVACVMHETPGKALSCIIDRLSGNMVLVYKAVGGLEEASGLEEATFSLILVPGSEHPPLPSSGLSLYRTIHIPEFHTAKELEMKLELSA